MYERGLIIRLFQVYVLKRPHVDEFLKRMGELFECVLFTASLAKVRTPPAAFTPPLLLHTLRVRLGLGFLHDSRPP